MPGIDFRVVQQLRDGTDDEVRVDPHQRGRARNGGFLSFCDLARDDNGFPQRGCLFLNAAGIGQDNVSALHQANERQVVLRRGQMDIGPALQRSAYWALHIGIGVQDVDDLQIFAGAEPQQRLTDAANAFAHILAPVAGDQQQPPA